LPVSSTIVSTKAETTVGSTDGPSMGFAGPTTHKATSSDLRRGSKPDCAAPTGFLNLMTRYSACYRPALFHAGNALGLEASRGLPLLVAATPLDAPAPLAVYQPESHPNENKWAASWLSQLQGLMHLEGPYHAGRCYPGTADRASHDLFPSEGFTPRASASCFHKASSHGLRLDPTK
jgi:hypothetical protein